MPELPPALLLDDNLLTASRVQLSLSDRYRVKLSRALPNDVQEVPQIVVLNLGSRSLNGIGLISASRERWPLSRVVGFCGHKEVEIRRAAKAAGIARLYTNEDALLGLLGIENVP